METSLQSSRSAVARPDRGWTTSGPSVDITAAAPLACGAAVWRFDGALRVTVVIKAAFALVPGGFARIKSGAEILTADRHYEGRETRSIEAPGDLAPRKARADVVLVGHAHAPGGQPTRASSVRVGVFRDRLLLDKTLHVYGDRLDEHQPAQPFQKMPLVYERTLGGPSSTGNPTGVGLDAMRPRPNIVDPASPTTPASFAPVPRAWTARRAVLTHADLRALQASITTFRRDFPWDFFQVAPPDQQLDALQGDEGLLLDGMHPSLPRIQTWLPSVRAMANVYRRTGSSYEEAQPVALAADTWMIDADRLLSWVVFRGDFAVPEGLAGLPALKVVGGLEIAGAPVGAAVDLRPARPIARAIVAEAPSAPAEETDPSASTRELRVSPPPTPALPFRAVSAVEPPPAHRPPSTPACERQLSPAFAVLDELTSESSALPRERPVLPFRAAPEAEPAPMSSLLTPPANEQYAPPDADGLSASTCELRVPPPSKPALPFQPARGSARASCPPAPPATGVRAELLARLAAGAALTGLALAGADLGGVDLSGRSLAGLDLRGAKLSSANLARADLRRAVLDGAWLDGADLTDADLSGARGEGASFEGARARRACFAKGRWEGAVFDRASLPEADFSGTALGRASFQQADLADARLESARAREAVFDGARLPRARMEGAVLTGASMRDVMAPKLVLDRASLTDARLDDAKLTGASLTSAACDRASFAGADLTGGRMGRVTADGADFSLAALDGADLRLAQAIGACFEGARLSGIQATRTDFSTSCFRDADLTNAILRPSQLHGADLAGATLDGADLRDADLTGATLTGASRSRARTSGALLDAVVHGAEGGHP